MATAAGLESMIQAGIEAALFDLMAQLHALKEAREDIRMATDHFGTLSESKAHPTEKHSIVLLPISKEDYEAKGVPVLAGSDASVAKRRHQLRIYQGSLTNCIHLVLALIDQSFMSEFKINYNFHL